VKISHTAYAAKVYFRSALHTGTKTVAPLAVKLHVLFVGDRREYLWFHHHQFVPKHQVILVRP
jgi:hypothetical protein